MLILAMDQSTPCGSLALLQDERMLGDINWTDSRRHNQQLFHRLTELLGRLSVELSQVDCFAVGLGPGSYTGLRIALAAALGFSISGAQKVYGLSSAEVIAVDMLTTWEASSIMVIGDARRHQLWARGFTLREGQCVSTTPWMLKFPPELAGLSAPVWVTPDWERIGPLLKSQVPAAVQLIEERQVPSAGSLGRVAFRKLRAGIPSEPLIPLYLHSAVTAPRAAERPMAIE